MTRRERLIHILNRVKHKLGAIGYDVATERDLEQCARDALWWRGLHRHNLRVLLRAPAIHIKDTP